MRVRVDLEAGTDIDEIAFDDLNDGYIRIILMDRFNGDIELL